MSVIPQSIAYKESGIPWVGKIPKHWEIKRVKYLFFISKEENTNENPNVLSLTQRGIVERDISTNQGQLAQSYLGYNIVKIGDIVFNPMDLLSGYVAKSQYNGVISQAYTKIRNKVPLDLGFYEKFFQNWYHLKILWHLGKGVSHDHRWTLGDDVLLNLEIPLPPLEEQKAIADFLDTKTRQIEEFIDKKQKLITLLEEKKQTLINQCVTQGLDPSTPLKDSGVEWIGKIPAHWEVKKLKYAVSLRNQKEGESDFRIGLENIESKTGRFIQADESAFDDEGIGFFEGDVLFGKLRPYLAKVFLADKNGICVSEFLVLKSEGILNRFLKFLMLSGVFIEVVNSSTYGTKMPRANWEFIGNLKIPIPPLEEQKAIAEYLDTQIEKIDLAICKIKSQINLIKEYKTTLISEAVCGRVEGI